MDSGDWKEWPLPGPPKLRYTLHDVALWLDVSDDTMRSLIEAGHFPRGHKVGNSQPTWTGVDLAAWLHLRDRWYPTPPPKRDEPGRSEPKRDEPGRKREGPKDSD